MECANCGGQVPDDGRFCPYCGAPQNPAADDPELDEAPAPPPAPARERAANLERIVFSALVLVTAAIVVLAILVFGFGFWVEEASTPAACNCGKPAYPV